MKNCLTAFFALIFSISSFAATITAVTSTLSPGDWTDGSTWSSGTVPKTGDLVIIPLGKGVEVGSQVYSSTAPTLSIEVTGSLHFRPSGKLDLSSTSYLQLFLGAKIIPQNTSSSQLINIGGVTKYNAANNGILIGPAFANSISGSSRPGVPLSGFDVGVLPVKLISFSGKVVGAKTELQWITAEETEVHSFELEKSNNEGRSWSHVSTTLAQGIASSYFATDYSQSSGSILYRLKVVNSNGSFAFSSNVKIDKQSPFTIFVSPNPSKGSVNVSLSETNSGNYSIVLLSFAGQTIKRVECNTGTNNYNLHVEGTAKGAYIVALYKDEKPVVKQTILIQ